MVFQEAYGELTKEQWRLYKKHSITPAEHYMLESYANYDAQQIIQIIKNSINKAGKLSPSFLMSAIAEINN